MGDSKAGENFTFDEVVVQLFWCWGGGEMADATDLKSVGGDSVWVRLPPAL